MNDFHLKTLSSPQWAEMLEKELLPWIERVADLGDHILEVGPGPGLTTDLLRRRVAQVTAIEVDDQLYARLVERLAGTNVAVLHGDAARIACSDDTFSAAACFGVLHHVPSPEAQNAVFGEICRVLQPGTSLLATDALADHPGTLQHHEGDTFVPLPIDTLADRLHAAGFGRVSIEPAAYEIRFMAVKPPR